MHSYVHQENTKPILHCNYSNSYATMYDSVYGTSFIFYEEELAYEQDFRSHSSMPSAADFSPMAAMKQNTSNHHH